MNIINIIEYEEGIKQLVKYAIRRKLIPVFGAGFTAGCQSINGIVPNGKRATESMCDMILNSGSCPLQECDIKEMTFSEISDLFFENVSRDERATYFEDFYTGVVLFQHQIDFLTKINWPYAYTLNVDDGIEKNSDFNPILPYHKFRRPKTSKRILYKLHGDAEYESKYIDKIQDNIVFSQSQYLQAITSEDNTDIYKALLADYAQEHLLFIGCSLQEERDLQFVYDKSKSSQKDAYRIVLRNEIPPLQEQRNLKKHGINEIILVENYESFYTYFLLAYQEYQTENKEKIYKYINPEIIIKTDKKESLELISNANIFNAETNAFLKGALHIFRNALRDIQRELNVSSFVLLKGRRFSGKTYVMCSLAEYYKKREVFYFPSELFADEEVVESVLSSQKNSLFLFDSNSISPDVYALIIKSSNALKENNNYLVIAINSNDNYLLTKINCNVVELKNEFYGDELSMSEKAQDSFGLARRKYGQTNIDYLYVLRKDQNLSIPFAPAKMLKLLSKERSALIALCALDKLYYSDLIALDLNRQEIENMCKKLSPFVEMIPTSEVEVTRHSTTKMVHNSKIAIVELLKQFQIKEISDSIFMIVKKYKSDYSRRRLYIDVILFDTLNQIFSGNDNSKILIYTIYENLQSLLENDLHYWLQRAKSIYRTQNGLENYEEAYTYAKKAYIDGDDALSTKAALTTALISCAIAEYKQGKEKLGYYVESVYLAYEAVFSEYFHRYPTYLSLELPVGKNTMSERRITEACKYVKLYSMQSSDIEKSDELLKYFEKK